MSSKKHFSNSIFKHSQITQLIKQWGENKKTVFTNGCFDILHLGHVEYLFKASKLGEKLIVGLNSDFSIKQIKGTTRPIQNEKSRASVLASLQFVDAVVLFNEKTPLKLIEVIRPQVLVKGGDYEIKHIIGSDFVLAYGGKVKTIPFIKGHSTSSIIDKIKNG